MTSLTASADGANVQDDPFGWVLEMVQYAAGVALMVLLFGGVLNMTWNAFATIFSFLDPISGGYWACVLVSLGAIGAQTLYQRVRDGSTLDLLNDFGGAVNLAARLGILMGLAWLVSNVLI